jgi:hypothetical protein
MEVENEADERILPAIQQTLQDRRRVYSRHHEIELLLEL